jgi:hypothetical protein
MMQSRGSWKPMCTVAGIIALLMPMGGCGDNDTITFPGVDGTPVLVSFQDGVDPDSSYSGTRDAFLKEGLYPNSENYGHMNSDTVGSLELVPGRYFERRFIVRMDLTSITDCAYVTGAILHLHVSPVISFPADTMTFESYEVTVPEVLTGSWPEGTGGTEGGVSWSYVDGDVRWDQEGGDIAPAPFDSATVAADDSVISFPVPNALVLRWISEPETNHGVVIKPAVSQGVHARIFHTRESSEPVDRPRLEIEYLRGG